MKLNSLYCLLLTILCSACGTRDYYKDAVEPCAYVPPSRRVVGPKAAETTLTPECKVALEKIIPYDSDGERSFDKAPPGFKDKVTETFQTLLAYPLRLPPDGKLLGVAPNTIPLFYRRLLDEAENPNQILFNYVLDRVQNIKFVLATKENKTWAAFYEPNAALQGVIHINEVMFQLDPTQPEKMVAVSPPLNETATLLHETRHGDGFVHSQCEFDYDIGSDSKDCDYELIGPYGFDVIYGEMLFHGMSKPRIDGTIARLSNDDISNIAPQMCYILRNRTKYLPKAVAQLLENNKSCGRFFNANWVLKQEGLL